MRAGVRERPYALNLTLNSAQLGLLRAAQLSSLACQAFVSHSFTSFAFIHNFDRVVVPRACALLSLRFVPVCDCLIRV